MREWSCSFYIPASDGKGWGKGGIMERGDEWADMVRIIDIRRG